MRRKGVAATRAVEEHRRLQAATPRHRQILIAALVGERQRVDLMSLRGAHEPARRQHNGHRLVRNERGLVDRLRGFALDNLRPPGVAVLLGILANFGRNELLQLRLTSQDTLELLTLFGERLLLVTNLHLFELREMTQTGVEDFLRLLLGELEALHEHRLRLVLATDDADHLVQIEVRDQHTFEDMQAARNLIEAVLQTASHRRNPEFEPFRQQVLETEHARPAIEADDVEIDTIVPLEIRRREQVVHDFHQVDAVRAGYDHEPHGVLVIRLVAQVLDHRELLRAHLLRDLLHHLGRRDLMWERGNDDIAVFDLVSGARLETTDALVVKLLQIRARRDDLRAGRQIGTLDELHQGRGRLRGILQQGDTGIGNFPQIVRRNVGCHAHGDARRTIQQQVRQSRRQNLRLFHRAVKVGLPVHRTVRELGQQHVRVAGEFRLGVAHSRERLRIVLRAPVALPVDDRIAIRERLCHQHHGFVAGRVAVRMVLADDVANRTRGLLVLVGSPQRQLAHRIDDAPLYRLQTVAERRQCTVENDVHRVIEIGLLGEGPQRLLLDALEIELLVIHVH